MFRSLPLTRARGRAIGALLVLAALALAAVPVPTANADELDDLQARRDELDAQIATADVELGELDAIIRSSSEDIIRSTTTLELTADEYARAVESRRLPAEFQRVAAIESYIHGDPRAQAFFEELQTLGNDSSTGVRRQLFSSVVDGATVELDAIDTSLVELGNRVDDLQDQRTEEESTLSEAQARHAEVTATRAILVADRSAVDERIEFLESLADRPVLTGLPGINPDRPALVVKIDNVDAARPQAGINQADIVYEERVEGGLTRLAVIFHSTDAPRVGPVRSARTTDINLLANLDRPLLSSSGANGTTRGMIADSTLLDIGHPEAPPSYFRDGSRQAPHNLFSTTADLWALDAGRGGRPGFLFLYRAPDDPLPPSARDVNGVSVAFPNVGVSYAWDGSGWSRTQGGRVHVDADGVEVAPANVIVQFVEYGVSPADANTPEAIVTGEGDAWIFTAGRVIEGRWSREEPTDRTIFTDDDETRSPSPPAAPGSSSSRPAARQFASSRSGSLARCARSVRLSFTEPAAPALVVAVPGWRSHTGTGAEPHRHGDGATPAQGRSHIGGGGWEAAGRLSPCSAAGSPPS